MRRPRRRKANEFEFEPNWLRLERLRAIGPGQIIEHRGKREYQVPVASYPEADGRINVINQVAKGMTFERFRQKAILRYGTLIPLAELAAFAHEDDQDWTDIGYGFGLSLLERDLRRGKF